MEENLVLIDWVTISTKEIDETGFKELLGMFILNFNKSIEQSNYER